VPSKNPSKAQSWPLRHGDPLHKTAMVKESCTLQDFHRALRARDPLGLGFSGNDLLLHLIWQLLAWDPDERMTPEEALNHPYFMSPGGTLESLNLVAGTHNALESQMLDPRLDFKIEDDVESFVCPKCGKTFHDWKSCHQHSNARKHAKFCTYDRSNLPTCINAHSMLPAHPTSG
jgi:serine/threonine protein kinase